MEYVEEKVTYRQIEALRNYWSDHPPLHLMIQGFLGYQKPKPMTADDLAEFLPKK